MIRWLASVRRLRADEGAVHITARLRSGDAPAYSAELELTGRFSGVTVRVPVTLSQQVTGKEEEPIKIGATATIAAHDLAAAGFTDDTYKVDILLQDTDGTEHRLALRRMHPFARLNLPAPIMIQGDFAGEFRAYPTFKARALRFEFKSLTRDAALLARQELAKPAGSFGKAGTQEVWLVGERPHLAQDNGLAFFRHMRQNHPHRSVHYVIREDSPDYETVAQYGNAVPYGSREHIRLAFAATHLIGSHHPDYLLPIRGEEFQKRIKAKRIFLQHGVMGTKNMVANYGYLAPEFEADAFIVSSTFEKNMISTDFGWPEDMVHVTGLARFDQLFADPEPPLKRILVIPTWRDWLHTAEDLEASQYLDRWRGLLSDPRFHELISAHGFEVDLYLHANVQAYAESFNIPNATFIDPGSTSVQELLKRSGIMITDYSSVGFDFAFLDKSVLYYQFDRFRFIGAHPSHLDLDAQLPGDVAITLDEVIEALAGALERGGGISEEGRRRASLFLDHRDRGACERIIAVVESAQRHRPPVSKYERLRMDSQVAATAKVTSNSVYKDNLVRAYSVLRRSPLDRNMVFFEANNGSSMGDSPKAIYEALKARYPDKTYVWGLNQSFMPKPPDADWVRRRTGKYFWARARAGAWVSNQNTGFGVELPPGGYLLQTWHGTPLKRMQWDALSTAGRDDGYLDRVKWQSEQWSTLLAPSEWAADRFRSAFRYDGPIDVIGYPRNDLLVSAEGEAIRQGIRHRLGISDKQKLVLYAPTFRDDAVSKGRFFAQDLLSIPDFVRGLPADHVLGVRFHPVVARSVGMYEGALNLSAYPDPQELLLAADVLLTDYSSMMFDFANRELPIIIFAPDLEHYRDELRGFYLDLEAEGPGPVVRTPEEVLALLHESATLSSHAARLKAFRERFCPYDDGQASQRAADLIVRALGWEG